MSLYQDPKSPHWQVSISVRGKPRLRRSTGTANKTEAKRIHDQWLAELHQAPDAGQHKSWQHAATAWLEAGDRGLPDRYVIRNLTEQIGSDTALSDINAERITTILNGKSAGTFNRRRNLVIAVLNHAKGLGWLDKPPTIKSRKTPPGRIRWLTRDEWSRLDAALAGHHLQPLARFAVATGLRQNNVIRLRWQDVDLARRVMWVNASEAKGRKPIGIPLSDDAIDALRGQIGQSAEWVFPYTHIRFGKETTAPLSEIGEAFNRACVRAGLDVIEVSSKDVNGKPIKIKRSTFRWHDLRHTWASWHVMSGTPLEVLQKLGGWATLSMVLRYAHLAPDHLAGFANNAKPYSSAQEKTA